MVDVAGSNGNDSDDEDGWKPRRWKKLQAGSNGLKESSEQGMESG
jgi:hypothetical protein